MLARPPARLACKWEAGIGCAPEGAKFARLSPATGDEEARICLQAFARSRPCLSSVCAYSFASLAPTIRPGSAKSSASSAC